MNRPTNRHSAIVVIAAVIIVIAGCASTDRGPSGSAGVTPQAPASAEPATVAPASAAPVPSTAAPGTAVPAGGAPGASPYPAQLFESVPYAPAIDPADFVAVIDNPYLPLTPGTMSIFDGDCGEHTEVTVTARTRQIMGVTVVEVTDQVFVDGKLAEDTLDWFAQDSQGNVWYFGEKTAEYEHGKITSTEGTWEAGVDGAQPGIVMPAQPQVGDDYRQEWYPGQAEDLARVIDIDAAVTVPQGAYTGALVTEEWSPLDAKVIEQKWYARGVGLVEEREVKGGRAVSQLTEIRTVP